MTSLPVADIVEQVLQVSDNEGAEVLARQTGIAVNGQGSFNGGAAAVRQVLTGLGIDLPDAKIYDGSGLSRDDRLERDVPGLRPPARGLRRPPRAPLRRHRPPGRGVRRLPRGPLRGLARPRLGAGQDRHPAGHQRPGRAWSPTPAADPLVFAFVSNHIPLVDTLDARAALDDLAATPRRPVVADERAPSVEPVETTAA